MIRPADLSDLELILDITNDAILNSAAIYEEEPWDLEKTKNWFENRINAGFPIVVIEYENKAVGFASYSTFRPRHCYRFTVEHSVYVHKNFRGKKLGAALLKSLIMYAESNGYHTMVGVIDATNKGSIEFHTKQGFEEVGKLKHVGYKFNQWQDVSILQLMLTHN